MRPASSYIVPDLLAQNLKLVFCGTAPSAISAREKAYYANPGNQFWQILHRARITLRQFHPSEYASLLELGIGLTDLCKTVSGNDDQLPTEALERDAVEAKIRKYQPKLLAFTSKHGASIFFGRKVEFGLQEETLGNTRFYVCCSTSGRARRFWREELWHELGTLYQNLKN